MAADDYVAKLPILYAEFAEAAGYAKGGVRFVSMFSSAEDLMQKTPLFWEKYVLRKLDQDFAGIHRYLNSPYPDGPNHYINRVEANMQELNQLLAAKRGEPVKQF
jgi:hypothetical protein